MNGAVPEVVSGDLRHAPCPVCSAAEGLPRIDLDFLPGFPAGMKLVRCGGCGTERIDPHPDPRRMAAHYDIDYYREGYLPHASRRRADFEVRAAELEGFAPVARARAEGRAPRCLDVGAGIGLFVQAARERGWHAVGFEPSPAAREIAAAASVELTPDWPAGRFDLVTLWDVLGHVEDPAELLRSIRRQLAPQGGLVLKIPNFRSSWHRMRTFMSARRRANLLHAPTVIWRFHRGAAIRLMRQCGFTLDSVRTVEEPDLQPLTPRWRLIRRACSAVDALLDSRQEMILRACAD